MPDHPATIKDVAAAAGVSVATVSRALAGKKWVAPETRVRIEAAAARLRFAVNPLFSVLGARRGGGAGAQRLVAAFVHGGAGQASLESLKRYAPESGFVVEDLPMAVEKDVAAVSRRLRDLGAAGAVLRDVPPAWLARLDLAHLPVVSIHRGGDDSGGYNSVGADRFYEMMMAWDQAVAAGHRRIGAAPCVMPEPSYDDTLRYGAIAAARHRWRDKLEDVPPFLGALDDLDGFMRWFRKHRPTCVIGFQMHLYWKLKSEGVRVPRDVSYVALIHGQPDGASDEITGFLDVDDEVCRVALAQLDSLLRQRVCGLPRHRFALRLA
ncbi:MAG: LacI family DNA-binding transcriptional regulator, partial [Planctomycetes bacterium]|nr:LacI family DNA-binding transcriptional regulator [Planctomycetota bacterium]